MRTSFFFVALSFALAASAAPHSPVNQVRQFGRSFGDNKGGSFGGNNGGSSGGGRGGSFGGKGGNNNNNSTGSTGSSSNSTASGNNQSAGGAAGANNTTATGSNSGSNNATAAGGDNSDPQQSLCLDPKVIAPGFANDGQDVPTAGQVASLTSTNNYINFCLTVPDLPLTNGQQIKTGSCNPAPMGIIPSSSNMPSAKFAQPTNGDVIPANTAFNITMNIKGLDTGFFVNADENYFDAPQQVGNQGQVQGHSHVVIESLSSLTQTDVTDPLVFAFFKGLNSAAVGGQLTASVDSGLPAGTYKLSSINTAANHQPVLVPIAQHGSLDDAVYFTVSDGGDASGASDVFGGSNSGNAAGSDAGAGNSTAVGAGNAGAGNSTATGTGKGGASKGGAGKGGAGNSTAAGAGDDGASNAGNSTVSGAGNAGNSTASGAGNVAGGKTAGGKSGSDRAGTSNSGQSQKQGQNGGRSSSGRFNRRFIPSRL